ncbi:SDR family NAD(P)-dependent oxidoreductase [Pseudonocardia zijingensis]|jgi:short-subunit dehydrogenase|uniref:SDR family oxidoreductase n=1 Tax=Pseudonocardia zijingensis TaxID=153376 RepID=A0ABP3ZR42_9PSEU
MPIALVTGASRGLGAAFAGRLARDGHDLVLVDRDQAGVERVAEFIRSTGRSVEVLVADLAEDKGLAAVQARVEDAERPIDLLVNNAGVSGETEFTQADMGKLQAEIDINITALMRLTRAAVPGMIERHRGAIINVASFAGYLAGRGDAYAASKAWVISFSDTVAASLAGTGVRMIALVAGQLRNAMVPAPPDASRDGLDPAAVVDTCLADLAKGRTLSVPGWRYRAVVDVLELPRRTLRAAARLAGKGRDQGDVLRKPTAPHA